MYIYLQAQKCGVNASENETKLVYLFLWLKCVYILTSVKTGEMTVVRLADLLSWSWTCGEEEEEEEMKGGEGEYFILVQFYTAKGKCIQNVK